MTRCDADFRINLRFIGIRHTAVDQNRATVLRYHARSVGARTTCTVRAETTQDGTIHAWMVCICLLGSMQTAVVEMCLIGTRGCALSLILVRAVSGSLIRSVLRLQDHITTNALYTLCSKSNRVERHKKKLGWNNTSVQPTTVAT